MDGQRHSSSRRRRSKRARTDNSPKGNERGKPPREEPILIAARRPNAPATHPKRRFIAASAAPRKSVTMDGAKAAAGIQAMTNASSRSNGQSVEESSSRRAVRIVQVQTVGPDDREKQRLKLIDRLLTSEGRVAITRAARELESAGFEFPVAQDVQLQLLEHIDESFAHQAIANLAQLLVDQAPIKRPLFEQRLRRLEEFAEDIETRRAAAELRRTLRA
jgi:hypothetical protein